MDLNSGYPFSLIKHGLLYDYPSLPEDSQVDILITGAGISGALAAHYLAEANINCMVIDGRTIGLGSTCASTSLLQYEIDVPLSELQDRIGLQQAVTAYQLGVTAINDLQQVAERIGFSDFQQVKSLYYAAKKKDDKFLKKEYRIRKANGFDVQLLSEQEVLDEFSIRASSAILSSKAAQTNAYCLTHALHQYNIKKGVKVYHRTRAAIVQHEKNKVIVTTDKGFTITAKKIIYATGYEVVEQVSKKILHLTSTYVICSEQMQKEKMAIKDGMIFWNTANPYLYGRTTNDNRMIIGGMDEYFYDPLKRDKLLFKKTKQLENEFERLFPGSSFITAFSWAGTFGSTKDGLPFIGTYKKMPDSYFALGFGGNGITFSIIAAAFLTDMILGKRNNSIDLFSFDRI